MLNFALTAKRVQDHYTIMLCGLTLDNEFPQKFSSIANLKHMCFYFPQDTNLEQIVQQMEVMVRFVSKPKVIRDGQAAMCVIRPPSAKELSQIKKNKTSPSQSANSISQDAQPKTPSSVSNTDTTEGSTQQ